MRLRDYTTLLSLLVGMVSYSQETYVNVETDSTEVHADIKFENAGIVSPSVLTRQYVPYSCNNGFSQGYYNQLLAVAPNLYDRNVVMPHIANLGGYVTSTSLPGLMGIESGSLSYSLSSDHISLTPAVYINKYGYYGGLTTSLGIGGQMSFRINDRFSITAFGSYHTNSWSGNQAVMSNMQSSRFGGYGTWNINEHWGLNVGAQRVYNSALNQWQTVPIVMPTFKINGNDAIGIDVGGLLYQIVDWNRNKNTFRQGNPTIGPPVRPQILIPPHQ